MHTHTRLNLSLESAEQRLKADIAAEQVTHVDLTEYATGSARHEQLWTSIEQAQRFSWPIDGWQVNV